jgi:alpha-mannosidase
MKKIVPSRGTHFLSAATSAAMRLLLAAGLGIAAPTVPIAQARYGPSSGRLAAQSTPGGGQATAAVTREAKGTFWIIPHTHWEGAVFKTREEYLESGLPNILTALNLLKTYPDYRFVLDQVAYVKPFLERYPEEEAVFRKFVSEGRLQIVGGNDVMLDVNIPSGESWIRQVLYGKGYYREKLGVDVTVGWGLDTFGHHAQMPQLLKLAGYKSYWFQRGTRSDNVPSEFLWQGIDGTQIPAFWLPLGYGLFYPAPKSLPEFEAYARATWDQLGHYSRSPDRVALAGADVSEPEETLPGLIHQANRNPAQPFTLRIGVPSDFESLAERHHRPTIVGELNPVFQGTYSNRIELKQRMRELEHDLTTVEKFSAWAAWLGLPAKDENLAPAWEPVLFNQAHDLTSGTMVDKVYEDTLRGYEFSKSLANVMIEAGVESIASKIDTQSSISSEADSIPVAVFNTLGWDRTDVAELTAGFSDPGVISVGLVDFAGRAVPRQLIDTERYSTGGIKDTRIAFVARDVPSLGYSLYQIVPQRASPGSSERPDELQPEEASQTTMHQDTGSIENEYYRAAFDLWTGEMTSLRVKSDSGGWEALAGPANVVAREQDGGDFWELYGILNGARLTAMNRKQGLPPPRTSHFSSEYVGGDGMVRQGPVLSEFSISHPFGEGSFATSVRLYPGIRRVDIKTRLINNDKFVRYRVLFPTCIKTGHRIDEIPFGAIERPTEQEFPAQNWTDWNDGAAKGVALLNRGLPGNNIASGALILSLMRSARITAYPFFGGYERGVSSDLGLELGVERNFEYALVPHTGEYQQWEICRAGLEFNNPLIVRPVSKHTGTLPGRWGLLEVSAPNVIVSALKPARRGALALRVYEAGNQRTENVRIELQPGVISASEANLLEEPLRKLPIRENTLVFDLAPYQIKTFKLELSKPGHEK